MTSFTFGPLQGITVSVSPDHEQSYRGALAEILDLLAKGQEAQLVKLLNQERGGKKLWWALGDALGRLARGRIYTRSQVVDMVEKATKKLGERDSEESKALSKPGRQVIAWPSGELLAFERVEGGYLDATERVLDELDQLDELDEPDEPEPAKERVEVGMCALCAGSIREGDEVAEWVGKPAHARCVEGERARRDAKGVYGTAEEMRQELARLGRPVGEVWDVRALEAAVLAARRETDEIPWQEYEARKAARKQGRPCVECNAAIVKGDEYRQASRGRKAHERCISVQANA